MIQARRRSVGVNVGGVQIGGGAPIVVQSMTNTRTAAAADTARQVAELVRAGSELVRMTVDTPEAAAAVPEIAARLEDLGAPVPLIGDFHYNGHRLLAAHPDCARILAKYRINPGNVGAGRKRDENFRRIIEIAPWSPLKRPKITGCPGITSFSARKCPASRISSMCTARLRRAATMPSIWA